MQVAHPHSGSPSTFPDQINWNLEILVWKKGGNGDARPKTSQSKGRTNKKNQLVHIWRQHQDMKHNGGKEMFSPLYHPCSSGLKV